MDRGQNLLRRLYKTQLALFGVICVTVGLGLLVLAQVDAIERLSLLPVKDIGAGLFATGLFATVVEYVLSGEMERRIRDSVITGFAVDPDRLNRITSPATRGEIIENCLTVELGDDDLAREVYANLRDHVIRVPERRYDTHVSITLTPWENGPAHGEGAMFVATLRWDYRMTGCTGVQRFACVTDAGGYRALLHDPDTAKVVYVDPTAGLDAGSPEVFGLLDYSINGVPQPVEHERHVGGQVFTVTNLDTTGAQQLVSFTYRVLTPRHGHLLFVDIEKPSKGIRADFTHHDCGIRYVNVPDFLGSPYDPRIHRSPQTAPISTISLSHDGWIYPKAGIAYTWTLNKELEHKP